MRTTQPGIDLIKSFEGLRLEAYLDSVGVPTIGYGTIRYPNGQAVKLGDKCSTEDAESYLRSDLEEFENSINKLVTAPITQPMFDALACFVYNLGASNFKSSTLLKLVNQQAYKSAADQFIRWNKAGGKELPGLTRRREAEAALFRSGIEKKVYKL